MVAEGVASDPHDTSIMYLIPFFQIRTLGGELVTIVRQENNVKFLAKSTEANLRASNIETAFGLVQVIDSVLI